jgi:hypothetical protein
LTRSFCRLTRSFCHLTSNSCRLTKNERNQNVVFQGQQGFIRELSGQGSVIRSPCHRLPHP